MPAELLEETTETEKESQKVLDPTPKPLPQICSQDVVQSPPAKSLLGRIFVGHEEFLGFTPD
jgi:hypothetical protein